MRRLLTRTIHIVLGTGWVLFGLSLLHLLGFPLRRNLEHTFWIVVVLAMIYYIMSDPMNYRRTRGGD